MPKYTRQTRFPAEQQELVLDMLLDGLPLPLDAPPEMSTLPTILADLAGPAGPSELAGEVAVLSRFQRSLSPAGIPGAHPAHRHAGRSRPRSRLAAHRARLAAIAVAAVAGLGGTAAAYAGVLPAPVQTFAHRMIGVPSTSPARPASGSHGRPGSHFPAAQPGATRRSRDPGMPGHALRSSPGAAPQPERSPRAWPSRSLSSRRTQPDRPSQASHSTGPHRPPQSSHHPSPSSSRPSSSHRTAPGREPGTAGARAPVPAGPAASRQASSQALRHSAGGRRAPAACQRTCRQRPAGQHSGSG